MFCSASSAHLDRWWVAAWQRGIPHAGEGGAVITVKGRQLEPKREAEGKGKDKGKARQSMGERDEEETGK
eukprot:16505-Heterococcus_DN1.PRE.2